MFVVTDKKNNHKLMNEFIKNKKKIRIESPGADVHTVPRDSALLPVCLFVLLTACTKNPSVNVPIKQTATVQERNTAEGGSSFFPFPPSSSSPSSFLFFVVIHPTLPPTHAARSANISHHNGKRLFVEELHIAPPPLSATHPRSPIGYRSLSCFVSFSSVARFQLRPPCEHKTGLGRAKPRRFQPASPMLLDLTQRFFGGFFFCFFFQRWTIVVAVVGDELGMMIYQPELRPSPA